MSNSFGRLFRFTTFGESHGVMIGAVIDGCPPRIKIDEAMVQQWLDRRRPGQSRFTTQRQEEDKVKIVSGLFDGVTTGTPIVMVIENQDQRSKDYGEIAQKFRPGHADYTYQQKYGLRDYRGGGRSSARETAMRVAVGAVAHQVLQHILGKDYGIDAGLIQMGRHHSDEKNYDWGGVWNNDFYTPDKKIVATFADYLDSIRKKGSSVGGMVQVVARGVPAGIGAPIYGKLSADLASAMMSINAVKAVAIGDGMNVAGMEGTDNNDEMQANKKGEVEFLSNHAGGILGGISTGQDIMVRVAIKPTSSILIPQKTVTTNGDNTDIVTKGRHDPCVAIRAVPITMAMMAITILDHLLLHRGQCGEVI
ncbi:MAG: chorismate synthase [Hydrotalea sp.]|nr:chorismate synthase [Hydrotalea sp.]